MASACTGLAGLALIALSGCAAPFAPAAPPAAADGVPSASAPLAFSPDGRTLWVVNPDADSVTPVDTVELRAGTPLAVGREPWSAAVTPGGDVVVMNRGDGSISVLSGSERRDLYLGPEPGGLALSPSGRLAYVTLSVQAEVAVVELADMRVVERVAVGPSPWAVAVTDDGDELDNDETVVVSHRFARQRAGSQDATDDGKEGWLTLLPAGEAREVVIEPFEFGYPNVFEAMAIGSGSVWLAHQLNSPEYPRDFETTVSAGLSAVPLAEQPVASSTDQHSAAPTGRLLGASAPVDYAAPQLRLHLNDESFSTPVNFPRSIGLAADGRSAYLALAGTDAVMGVDLQDPDAPTLIGFWPTGSNPRGLVVEASGSRAYVMNYLSRDLSVLDLTDRVARREVARVPLAGEVLDPVALRGKVIFNNANDPRLSHLGWVSCASCHPDGNADGTTWHTPDGPRQTMPLWSLAGTAPFHASATRDEVQDFEHDIEGLMAGNGLAAGPPELELGAPNGGISVDLDALAHYVLTGIRTPAALDLDAAAVARGRRLFAAAGCNECHGGPSWTVSSLPGPVGSLGAVGEREVKAVLVDVGTFRPGVDVLGADGFDVPSLLGIGASAPYLHGGSAATLEEVLDNLVHAPIELTRDQRDDLVAFLAGIDDGTAPVAR